MTKFPILRRRTLARNGSAELDRLKGFPGDGRKRIFVLSNDYARVMLVPERNRNPVEQLMLSKYESLKALARSKPTTQEKEEIVRKMRSENIIRERKLREQIKLAEKEKLESLKAPVPSDQDRDKFVREKHYKQRAEGLKLEDEDLMKVFNSEIAKAKCTAILQKQIKQNYLKQKKIKEEEEKQEKDLKEMNETLYYKRRAEEDKQKRDTIKNFTELLAKQCKLKEMEKSLRKAEIEKEETNRNLLVAKQNIRDIEIMKKREEDRKILLQQQKDLILTAQILKEKQIEEDKLLDEKHEKIRTYQEEQERIAKETFSKRLKARYGATDLVCAKKKQEEMLKIEAEEFERQRRDNILDKEWRQKEKERIVNDMERKKDFLQGIKDQVDDNYKQKIKEIMNEIEDAQRIENKLKESDIQTEKYNKKKLEEKKELAEYLQKEAQEKTRLKQREERELERYRVEMEILELRRKKILEKALDDKIQNLRSYHMDERLINSVKQKAETLKEKI